MMPETGIQPSPAETEKLQALIKSYCGIKVEPRKLEFCLQRAWPKLAALGVADLAGLIRELNFMAGRAWAVLLPFVTINETYFMRENRQLDYFLDEALPGLRERAARRGASMLQVLSAACSTGEEAYTLAMLLGERNVDCRITGVDIDPEALAKAEAAVYGPNAFRGVDPEWRARHFEPLDEKSWWVNRADRERVGFRRVNLLNIEEGLAGRRYDAIFCRNVLIYFERATQQAVIHQLARLLVPGGCLFLGHSELFFDLDLGLKVHSSPRATMYQQECTP